MASDNSLLTIAVILVVLAGAAFYMTYNNQFAFNKVLLQPTELGNVTVEVETAISIEVNPDDIDWGVGFVNTTAGAPLYSNLTTENIYENFVTGTPQPNSAGFNVENTGNVNVTLEIQTGKTAATFVGGNSPISPLYEYKVTDCSVANAGSFNCVLGAGDDLTPSCTSTGTFVKEVYTDVNTSTGTGTVGTLVCGQFGNLADNNKLRIDIRILIPEDAPKEVKKDTMVITATQANP